MRVEFYSGSKVGQSRRVSIRSVDEEVNPTRIGGRSRPHEFPRGASHLDSLHVSTGAAQGRAQAASGPLAERSRRKRSLVGHEPLPSI